jgi:hypothetical protein
MGAWFSKADRVHSNVTARLCLLDAPRPEPHAKESRPPPLASLVFYAILTTRSNHATRCLAIKRTWGAHLDWHQLVFYSDEAETRLSQLHVVPQAYPGAGLFASKYSVAQDRFTQLVMPDAVRRMASRNMSWLFWGDDDTFVWPENLHALLARHDSSQWVWLGQECGSDRAERSSFCGGAGFAMSMPLATVAACVVPQCVPYKRYAIASDRRMGMCFRELLNVSVSDSREFNSQPPHWYMTRVGGENRPTGFGKAATFHYLKTETRAVSPEQYYAALWSLTRAAHSARA